MATILATNCCAPSASASVPASAAQTSWRALVGTSSWCCSTRCAMRPAPCWWPKKSTPPCARPLRLPSTAWKSPAVRAWHSTQSMATPKPSWPNAPTWPCTKPKTPDATKCAYTPQIYQANENCFSLDLLYSATFKNTGHLAAPRFRSFGVPMLTLTRPVARTRLPSPTLLALAAAATCALANAQTAPTPASSTTLSEVVVSAAGFEQELKQAPASISVVTREELESKNFRDLAEALQGVEGIDVLGGTGKTGGLDISIRGMPSDYTLILIDGRRQNVAGDVTPNGFGEAATGFMPPLSAIERIEVIRGPMSTLYGSDAMGGVINIITKKVSDEWNGNVTISGNVMENNAEADSWKTSFVVNGPLINDRLGLQLRGSYLDRQRSERIVDGSTGRDPRPNKADNYDVGAKLDFK